MIPPPSKTVTSNDPRLINQTITFDPNIPKNKPSAVQKNQRSQVTNQSKPSTTTNTNSTTPESSSYGMHSHSGDLIEEDIYVSDGSDDEDTIQFTTTHTHTHTTPPTHTRARARAHTHTQTRAHNFFSERAR